MRGLVNDRLEAVIAVRVIGPTGASVIVDAVVDTGFNGMLTLPSATIEALDLSWRLAMKHRLADGSLHLFDVYRAEVDWAGSRRLIPVLAAETHPLIGMELLKDFRLQVAVRPGGPVIITPIVDEGDAAGETLVI